MLVNQGLHFDCYGESLMHLESTNEKQMKSQRILINYLSTISLLIPKKGF